MPYSDKLPTSYTLHTFSLLRTKLKSFLFKVKISIVKILSTFSVDVFPMLLTFLKSLYQKMLIKSKLLHI